MKEINVQINKEKQYITIEGINYSFSLFKSWGKDGLPINSVFKIVNRADNVIDLKVISTNE